MNNIKASIIMHLLINLLNVPFFPLYIHKVPEMLRMPLVELCLQIKILSLGHIKPFLSKVTTPS